MDTDLLGLPVNTMTALTVIVTGVIIPPVTALLKYPGIEPWLKRLIPIALAALGAIFIIVIQAGGPFAEQLLTWLLMLATLVGIAQALYAAMPGVWKGIEKATHTQVVESKRKDGAHDRDTSGS